MIATASLSVAAKSMLSATATWTELRAPTLSFCALRDSPLRIAAARCAFVPSRGVVLFRGPRLSQPKRSHRVLHVQGLLFSGSHDVSRPFSQPVTSQAIGGSRSLMAAASVQVPRAALVQQQEDIKDRTAHQEDNPLHSILLQADSAAQPFLASPAEQPTRARVDYSKSQRPLQVLVQNHRCNICLSAGCLQWLQCCCCTHPATLLCLGSPTYTSACRCLHGS